MPEAEDHQTLSFGDALFLYLERDGMPLHVASVCVFEGDMTLEDCARFVESKLPLIPRYRQRAVSPPFNIGPPIWEYDPNFDVHNHVRELSLKRGTEAELKAVASRTLSAAMDRTRPLWDLLLVHGLTGGRMGLVIRVHHSLADGISGVGLMRVLMDASPVVAPLPKKVHFHAPPPRDATSLLLDGLIESCFAGVQRVLTMHSELLTAAQRAFAAAPPAVDPTDAGAETEASPNGQLPALDLLRGMLPELASPAKRLPFNIVCQGPQKFTWTEIPLPAMKAVKHVCGATVNDVALVIVTAAIARYAKLHGVRLRGRTLRIVVPVSVRDRSQMGEMGNHITFVPVTIPLDEPNLRKLTCAVHGKTALLKQTHVAEMIGLAGSLLGTIPAPVQALLGPLASQLPLSVCNLICTNVPGPKSALYLMGHKMLACYPRVPIGGEMGLNIALLTYNGVAFFGFTGDVHAVPDIEKLPKFVKQSFQELQKAAGIRRAARPKISRPPAEAAVADPAPLPPPVAIDFPRQEPQPKEEPAEVLSAAIGAA